jgi:hypothetical protein
MKLGRLIWPLLDIFDHSFSHRRGKAAHQRAPRQPPKRIIDLRRPDNCSMPQQMSGACRQGFQDERHLRAKPYTTRTVVPFSNEWPFVRTEHRETLAYGTKPVEAPVLEVDRALEPLTRGWYACAPEHCIRPF